MEYFKKQEEKFETNQLVKYKKQFWSLKNVHYMFGTLKQITLSNGTKEEVLKSGFEKLKTRVDLVVRI